MTLSDLDLESRLRRDLSVVADTVTGEPMVRSSRRRRRWLAIGAGVVVVPVLATAAAVVRTGPEYVDTIPAETIIVRGDIDGDRYLLVETRRVNPRCDAPVTGVELVEEDQNLLGSEWNTIGEEYAFVGECTLDTATWLSDPSLHTNGGAEVGGSFVWLWAVHPSVTSVRITTQDGTEDLRPYSVDGAGYAIWEIPRGVATYTYELVVGHEAVPGTRTEKQVPQTD